MLTTFVRAHPRPAAVVAGLVAVMVWFVLASTTHLIFHLMPAGAPLAGAAVMRTSLDLPERRATILVTLGLTIALGAAGAVAINAAALPTDGVPATAGTIALGALVAVWLLRSSLR